MAWILKRDAIASACIALGYQTKVSNKEGYILYKITNANGPSQDKITIWIGRNGRTMGCYGQGSPCFTLNSAAIAALKSAGEYIHLRGQLSTSELKRIRDLIP